MFEELFSTENLHILKAFWLFPVVVLLHELEEWKIMKWYRRNFIDVLPMSGKVAHIGLIFASFTSFLWTAASTVLGNPTIAAFAMLPQIASFFQNLLQHIYWLLRFKQYAPGVVTSVLLLVPVGSYLSARAVIEKYAPVWYLILLAIWIMLGLIQTVRTGNRFQVRAVHKVAIRLSEWLE
jgi:hypothetical protein